VVRALVQMPCVMQFFSCCRVLAQDAALEKARAGQDRDVEQHVGLYDDQMLQAQEAARQAKKRSWRSSRAGRQHSWLRPRSGAIVVYSLRPGYMLQHAAVRGRGSRGVSARHYPAKLCGCGPQRTSGARSHARRPSVYTPCGPL